MIPPPRGEFLEVEPYASLPLEAAAFRGEPPVEVTGVKLATDFDLVLRQKLFLHNCTHACFAYSGRQRGYADIPRRMQDANLVASVRAASEEVIAGLAHGHADADNVIAECRQLVTDLFARYTNTALGDSTFRVGRDPWRKLAHDDRLLGPASNVHRTWDTMSPSVSAHFSCP